MYDRPHAYDIVFDIDTVKECDFLEVVHQRHGRSAGRRVLEPACGTGRLLREFERRGWTASGFDSSDEMLDYARERTTGPEGSARIRRARFDDFRFEGRFDLAHCLVSSIQHADSDETVKHHLRLVADHLDPGGLYVLSMHLADRPELIMETETFHGEREGTAVTCVIDGDEPDLGRRRQRIRARLHVEDGTGRRERHESSWWFRTWTREQFIDLLASEPGLELVALHDFALDADRSYGLEDDLVDVIAVLRRR